MYLYFIKKFLVKYTNKMTENKICRYLYLSISTYVPIYTYILYKLHRYK